MTQTCNRCYKVVDRACQSESEAIECPNLFRRLYLTNEYGRGAFSYDVLPMLGLPSHGHLPVEGMPPRLIQGIKVWVEPKTFVKPEGYRRHWREGCVHRVMAECPACGKAMSAGRLQQHASLVHKS